MPNSFSTSNIYYESIRINEKAAIFSSIMVSFVPILFLQSLFGISITLFLFFLLLGFYFLSVPCGIERKYYFLSGICFGLAAATRAQDIVLMLPAITFYIFSKESKCSTIQKFYNLSVFVGIIVLISFMFYMPGIIDSHPNTLGSSFLQNFNYSVTKNFLGLFSKRFPTAISELIASLTAFGFILALLGLINLGFKNRNLLIFLCLWIAFPLFFYGNIRALCLLRYLSIIIPALIICQSSIFQYSSKNLFLMISKILAFILIVAFLFYKIYPIAYCRHKNAILPDFARWVEKNTPSNAMIISTDDALFTEYYGHRKILHRPASAYGTSKKEILQFKENLDQLLAKEIPIYINDVGVFSYDNNGIFFNFITECYENEFVGEYPYELWFAGATYLRIEDIGLYRLKNKGSTSTAVLKE